MKQKDDQEYIRDRNRISLPMMLNSNPKLTVSRRSRRQYIKRSLLSIMSSSASYIQCKATFALVSISLLIAASCPFQTEARSVNLPSPQCHPSIINSMPPKIRKICEALSTIWEFSDAMENYLDEKGHFVMKSEAKAMGAQRNSEFQQNTSVKRKSAEDVDHVFLRFGKR